MYRYVARVCWAAVITHALMEIDPKFPVVGKDALAELAEEGKALEAETPEDVAPDPVEVKIDREDVTEGET